VKLMLETLPKAEWPHAAIIGLPPKKHGGTRTDADLELILGMAGISMYMDKPISASPPGALDGEGPAALAKSS